MSTPSTTSRRRQRGVVGSSSKAHAPLTSQAARPATAPAPGASLDVLEQVQSVEHVAHPMLKPNPSGGCITGYSPASGPSSLDIARGDCSILMGSGSSSHGTAAENCEDTVPWPPAVCAPSGKRSGGLVLDLLDATGQVHVLSGTGASGLLRKRSIGACCYGRCSTRDVADGAQAAVGARSLGIGLVTISVDARRRRGVDVGVGRRRV